MAVRRFHKSINAPSCDRNGSPSRFSQAIGAEELAAGLMTFGHADLSSNTAKQRKITR
jgi:hypothetical protein